MGMRVCWKCDAQSHMTPHGDPITKDIGSGQQRVSLAYVCDNCGILNFAIAIRQPVAGNARVWMDSKEDVTWYPVKVLTKEFPDVPEHIAGAATEAYECLSISARRAAVQLARSVIEATAKDKGITKGQLAVKIEEMFKQNLIREHIRDGADEVRHLGNDMAHGDFVDEISIEDADLVLTLMAEVLDEVYQSPARVAQAKAVRAAKKNSSSAAQTP
jgi:hypothetical protein